MAREKWIKDHEVDYKKLNSDILRRLRQIRGSPNKNLNTDLIAQTLKQKQFSFLNKQRNSVGSLSKQPQTEISLPDIHMKNNPLMSRNPDLEKYVDNEGKKSKRNRSQETIGNQYINNYEISENTPRAIRKPTIIIQDVDQSITRSYNLLPATVNNETSKDYENINVTRSKSKFQMVIPEKVYKRKSQSVIKGKKKELSNQKYTSQQRPAKRLEIDVK